MNWQFRRSISETCDFEVIDTDGEIIAGEYGIPDEGIARLIAAAPDLLAALRHSVIDRDEWLSEARAAMAKAEGDAA